MRDVTSQNFGLLIAYLLPGFTLLWGISHVSTTVRGWLGTPPSDAPTLGGFLYVTVASVAIGLFASTVRWLVVDSIHHRTGVGEPNWNLQRLGERVSAFTALVESHYRYYQCFGGMLIALPMALTLRWWAAGFRWGELALVVATELLFFVASRDSLSKYYRRVEQMLRE